MKSDFVVHRDDQKKVSVDLTDFHTVTIIHDPGQGLTIEVVDNRLGDTVNVLSHDLEDLNCCMDPDEV